MNLLEILVLAATCWLVREVRQLRRDAGAVEIALADFHLETRGRLAVIDDRANEAVGRLTVLTAEHAGGYESDTFARVSAGGREQLETATTGLESWRFN